MHKAQKMDTRTRISDQCPINPAHPFLARIKLRLLSILQGQSDPLSTLGIISFTVSKDFAWRANFYHFGLWIVVCDYLDQKTSWQFLPSFRFARLSQLCPHPKRCIPRHWWNSCISAQDGSRQHIGRSEVERTSGFRGYGGRLSRRLSRRWTSKILYKISQCCIFSVWICRGPVMVRLQAQTTYWRAHDNAIACIAHRILFIHQYKRHE